MKKLFFASAIVALAAFSTGCNSAANGDPKTVLIAFFDALGKKDIAGAKKLATKESESMFTMLEMGMKMGGDKADNKFDKTNMEFGETKIEGDKATVAVKDKKSNETTNFILKKEGGAWKVAFDKASFMQMGADKIKNEGGMDNLDDKMKEGLDKLKDINADSLKNSMEEGLKSLDSLKELLKKN